VLNEWNPVALGGRRIFSGQMVSFSKALLLKFPFFCCNIGAILVQYTGKRIARE